MFFPADYENKLEEEIVIRKQRADENTHNYELAAGTLFYRYGGLKTNEKFKFLYNNAQSTSTFYDKTTELGQYRGCLQKFEDLRAGGGKTERIGEEEYNNQLL